MTQIEALRRGAEGLPSGAREVIEAAEGSRSSEIEALEREIAKLRAAREEAVAAHERLTYLSEASQALASSLDYEATLDTVARLAVPVMGDLCIVLVRSETDERLEVGAVRAQPSKERLLCDLVASYTDAPSTREHPVDVVLRTGISRLIEGMIDAYLASIGADAEQVKKIRELSMSCVLVVPLKTRGRVLGILLLALTRRGVSYEARDIELAEELARRAAAALDNALLHRSERRARAAAECAAERTARLQEVALSLAEALTPSQVAAAILKHAAEVFGAEHGVVAACKDGVESMTLLAARGEHGRLAEELYPHCACASGVMSPDLLAREPVVLSALERRAQTPRLFEDSPSQDALGLIAIRLAVQDRVFGVLGLAVPDRPDLSAPDRDFLLLLARQGAQALARARLFEQAEAERVKLEAVLRRLPGGVAIIDATTWEILLSNDHMSRLVGGPGHHDPGVPGRRPWRGFHADGRPYEAHEWPVVRAITAGDEVDGDEITIEQADKSRKIVRVSAAPVRDREGRIIAGVTTFYEITGQKEAERALRASEERYRLAERASSAYLFVINFAAREVTYSDALERVFKYEVASLPTDLDGSTAWWLSCVHPDDRERMRETFYSLLVSDVEASSTEYRFRRGDGRYAWVLDNVYIARTERGEPTMLVSSVMDLSDRMRALETQSHLAALGTLAAGVAHEINNPLAYVITNLERIAGGLERLRARGQPGPLSQELASLGQAALDGKDGATRVAEIARGLKTLSRGDDETRRSADLRAAVDMAVKMAAAEAQGRARIVKEYGAVPMVEANEPRLVQVFINLIVNAAQAIPEGAAGEHEIRVITRTDDAGRAVVEVRDTGDGIAPENLSRIFEPFFTTKPVGVGTGIGLSICRGIVVAHGGDIRVESEPGRGSVFRVVLPPILGGAADVGGGSPLGAGAGAAQRRGRVLVIDDEVKLGRAIALELSDEHDAELMTSGAEVLGRFQKGERFDIILCDLLMPSMPGMTLYEAIRRVDPAQAERMIFITGGAYTPAARRFLSEVKNRCLEKPFDTEELRAIVLEALR